MLYAKFDRILLAIFKITVKNFWLTFIVDTVYNTDRTWDRTQSAHMKYTHVMAMYYASKCK